VEFRAEVELWMLDDGSISLDSSEEESGGGIAVRPAADRDDDDMDPSAADGDDSPMVEK